MQKSKREKLTQKRLKELLDYDPETGFFTWKENRGGTARVGSIAGAINDNGYRTILVDQRRYKASRMAWLFMKGYLPEHDVDHEDRNRQNDKWKNLRHMTRSCNLKNTKMNIRNTSGVKGVQFHTKTKKWEARIQNDGLSEHLGLFSEKVEAVAVRFIAEKKHGWDNCNGSESSASAFLRTGGVDVKNIDTSQKMFDKVFRRDKEYQKRVIGVSFRKDNKTWAACIYVDGKNKHLGLFISQETAAIARVRAEKKYKGSVHTGKNSASYFLEKIVGEQYV